MKHVTIDYGIDLGTTNSAICRMEHGVPVVIRSDSGMEPYALGNRPMRIWVLTGFGL